MLPSYPVGHPRPVVGSVLYQIRKHSTSCLHLHTNFKRPEGANYDELNVKLTGGAALVAGWDGSVCRTLFEPQPTLNSELSLRIGWRIKGKLGRVRLGAKGGHNCLPAPYHYHCIATVASTCDTAELYIVASVV